jgi:hypothetical protein
MMSSPQDSNGGEMPPYGMRNMPSGMPQGPNPMVKIKIIFLFNHFSCVKYHDPHLTHIPSMPPDISHHGSINGIYLNKFFIQQN